MDENVGKFIDDFAVLTHLALAGQHGSSAGPQLVATLTEHLGAPAQDLPVVVEEISAHRFVDADIVLADIAVPVFRWRSCSGNPTGSTDGRTPHWKCSARILEPLRTSWPMCAGSCSATAS